MGYTKQWIEEQLKQLYPNRQFTDKQKELLLNALNEGELKVFSQTDSDSVQIPSRILLECNQELPDTSNILGKLREKNK